MKSWKLGTWCLLICATAFVCVAAQYQEVGIAEKFSGKHMVLDWMTAKYLKSPGPTIAEKEKYFEIYVKRKGLYREFRLDKSSSIAVPEGKITVVLDSPEHVADAVNNAIIVGYNKMGLPVYETTQHSFDVMEFQYHVGMNGVEMKLIPAQDNNEKALIRNEKLRFGKEDDLLYHYEAHDNSLTVPQDEISYRNCIETASHDIKQIKAQLEKDLTSIENELEKTSDSEIQKHKNCKEACSMKDGKCKKGCKPKKQVLEAKKTNISGQVKNIPKKHKEKNIECSNSHPAAIPSTLRRYLMKRTGNHRNVMRSSRRREFGLERYHRKRLFRRQF